MDKPKFDPNDPLIAEPSAEEVMDTNLERETISPIHQQSQATPDQSAAAVGRLIAEQMESHEYHPVVIFGSANAGKSVLLGSLFSYLQIDAHAAIGIQLGEPFLPNTDDFGRKSYELAETFFYRDVQEFLNGTAHAATASPFPFFIPIRIIPKNKPEIKIAFMESRGEWYKPEPDSGRYFPIMKAEINSVLTHYQRGISFIHIAPYTQTKTWAEGIDDPGVEKTEINNANLALVGAFNAYEKTRAFKEEDSHLFLMTKWDAHQRNNGHSSLENTLTNVDPQDFEAILKKLYLKGYTSFNNINIDIKQKSQMQYCAGIMSGREIIQANEDVREILKRYPQTLWNWLYANATRCHPRMQKKALQLFPKPTPARKNMLDHLNSLFDRILH